MAAPAKLLRSGPANKVVRGLLNKSDMVDVGALVGGRDGLLFVDPELDPDPPDCRLSRVLESQQMDPRSQRLGGLLTMTDGFEQKADIKPGKQTPGQRFGRGAVVVVGAAVVVIFGLAVVGLAVVVVAKDGLELLGEGRDPEAGAVTLFVFCSLIPPLPSRRLMQHFPPLAQTALASIKSQRYEKNPVTHVPFKKSDINNNKFKSTEKPFQR